MEQFSGIEGETTTYNHEAVKALAMEDALDRLEAKFPGIMSLPTAEKIPKLRELKGELEATVEGTTIPLHNELRYVAASLQRLLLVEEAQLRITEAQVEYEALLDRLNVKA